MWFSCWCEQSHGINKQCLRGVRTGVCVSFCLRFNRNNIRRPAFTLSQYLDVSQSHTGFNGISNRSIGTATHSLWASNLNCRFKKNSLHLGSYMFKRAQSNYAHKGDTRLRVLRAQRIHTGDVGLFFQIQAKNFCIWWQSRNLCDQQIRVRSFAWQRMLLAAARLAQARS